MYDIKAKIKTYGFTLNLKCVAKNIIEINECIKTKLRELNYFGDYKIVSIKMRKIKKELK